MVTFLLVVHVLISFLLIFIVLVQGGKGAELGAAFGGGSSQTLFGGRGAATFLNKMTTVVAVAFMLTSLLLAVAAVKMPSVIKKTPTPVGQQIPPLQTTPPATAPVGAQPAAPAQPSPGPAEKPLN